MSARMVRHGDRFKIYREKGVPAGRKPAWVLHAVPRDVHLPNLYYRPNPTRFGIQRVVIVDDTRARRALRCVSWNEALVFLLALSRWLDRQEYRR